MKATWPLAALGSHSSSLAILEVREIFSINSRGKVMGRTMLGVMHHFSISYCGERMDYFDWLNMDHMFQPCSHGRMVSHDGRFLQELLGIG